MELEEILCKRCGAPISGENFNWDLGLATCAHCGTVFKLPERAQPALSSQLGDFLQSVISLPQHPTAFARDAATGDRPPVPLPAKLDVVREAGELRMTHRWFSPRFIGMAVFAVFWNGFMLFWHGMALASGAWTMSLFGLLHTAVGIGVGYYTLAGFLNRTTVRAERDHLQIRHAPLPWLGELDARGSELEQLYAKQVVSRNDNNTTITYELHAVLRTGRDRALVKGLDKPELALYLEQELERYLGIRDRPVAGELH